MFAEEELLDEELLLTLRLELLLLTLRLELLPLVLRDTLELLFPLLLRDVLELETLRLELELVLLGRLYVEPDCVERSELERLDVAGATLLTA